MDPDPQQSSCVVVGAGVSGLLAARELASAGWRVVVMDEGRGVGGRMATRRVGAGTFDHGAQFFTVRSERFGALVETWLEAGVVREWSRGFADADGRPNRDGYPRYRGAGGMTSIPEHLARDLDVRLEEEVTSAMVREGAWEVRAASGARERAGALLLAAPVPQVLGLFDAGESGLSEESRRRLAGISYSPCLALMALIDGPTGVPEPGGIQIKGEPLDWISDNMQKGISETPGITVHARPRWSRAHFEDEEEEITLSLLSLAGERLGQPLRDRVVETSLARWRYSWVEEGLEDRCLVARETPPLIFAGDAFGGAKIEGAALSGLAAADRLLGRADGP